MSNILNSENFGLKIYNRFPPKYREDDVGQNLALKRYLQALSDGGFKYSIDEINGITHLIDPEKVDAKVLPILFQQYGLDIFNGIPEEYLRYLLPKLGEAWSKKGSLSVVEFITSSLSGIRTSTNVSYDEFNNPTVDVKFEMDYSLGDYFPNSDQFKKLLVNFLPFYCDMNFIYTYMFYDGITLHGKDEDLFIIHDVKEESGLFRLRSGDVIIGDTSALFGEATFGQAIFNAPSIYTVGDEVDTHEDHIIHIPRELGRMTSIEEDLKTISLTPLHDTSTLKGIDDYAVDNATLSYNEGAGFKLLKDLENPETNAVLGVAVMGKAVLGVQREQADTHEDHIVYSVKDGGNLSSPIDTLTNKRYNTLNNSFYTNGLFSYDIVTIGDSTEVVFN